MDKVIYIKEVKKACDGLINYYKGSDKVKKVRLQTLKRKYELLQMETTETISDFFSNTLNLVNEMKVNGDTIEDSAIIEKILRSLPKKFESKVTAIEEFEEALQSQVRWTNNQGNSNSGGRPNNGSYQGRYNTGGRSNNGSYQGRRPTVANNYQANFKANFKANIAGSQEEEEEEEEEEKAENMSLACHTLEEKPQHKWYSDTRCSNHFCGRKDLFDNLD
ncbi:uncharacterized protein LOC113295361 [Papaver somniferum]|uniref:uncharacterized protein LOC113295361 n=1 Tax=Papaver somniferum TaxID=3469 RepID=UPI000E6F4DE7|nr:uncharacterized protein LOC113295361 [Papaver somniferum]